MTRPGLLRAFERKLHKDERLLADYRHSRGRATAADRVLAAVPAALLVLLFLTGVWPLRIGSLLYVPALLTLPPLAYRWVVRTRVRRRRLGRDVRPRG